MPRVAKSRTDWSVAHEDQDRALPGEATLGENTQSMRPPHFGTIPRGGHRSVEVLKKSPRRGAGNRGIAEEINRGKHLEIDAGVQRGAGRRYACG